MSLRLGPGIRPGRRIALASACCVTKTTTFLTSSIMRVLAGARPVLSCGHGVRLELVK